MNSAWKGSLIIGMFAIAFMGILQSPALGVQMTIEAIDDSGLYPGEAAYLKFVYSGGEYPVTTAMVPNPWTSKQEVDDYGNLKEIIDWQLNSASNIWSSDLIVGDALTGLQAGVYRVSVVSGAFMYDSFDWSDYKDQWWWQLHIQSSMEPASVILGDTNPFGSAASALANSLGKYLDIPVNEGGSLIFWIWDWNSIDNLGSLTFDVTPIPEPSTLILAGTGLLFLAGRFRRSITRLFTR